MIAISRRAPRPGRARLLAVTTLVVVLAAARSAPAACDHNTAPPPDARTGIGWIDYKLCHWETVFNGAMSQLWKYLYVAPISLTIPSPVASDDNVPAPWIADTATTLQRVRCRVAGACTTPPVYALASDTGAAITLSGTLTCGTGAAAAASVPIASGGSIAAGHGFTISTTNAPSGDCTFAVVSVVAAGTLP